MLVTTDDQPASELAEKEIHGVIDDVAAGKIALYTVPSQSTEETEENAPATPAIEFGLVKVGAVMQARSGCSIACWPSSPTCTVRPSRWRFWSTAGVARCSRRSARAFTVTIWSRTSSSSQVRVPVR